MTTPILTKNLKDSYYMFGNKGAVWDNKAHIAGGPNRRAETLCGTPMLSSNHARLQDVQECGCPECIRIYNEEINKD